jgi:hypothetical protein
MAEYWERTSEPRSGPRPGEDGGVETSADQVSELWRLLGVTGEKRVDAAEESSAATETPVDVTRAELDVTSAELDVTRPEPTGPWSTPAPDASVGTPTTFAAGGGWKVEPLPTAAEGGIAALFAQTLEIADSPTPPPPPDPAAVSTLVPEMLRGTDTLESLLAGPSTLRMPAEPEVAPPSGPPSLDSFASAPAVPLLGSQPPAWGPDAGGLPEQSGRARLAEMLDHLPDEPTHRVSADDIHVDRPVVAPAAIWFWGDDDIYAGRAASAARPQTKLARRRQKALARLPGPAPAAVGAPEAKLAKLRRLRPR